jgi:hypothetical protein
MLHTTAWRQQQQQAWMQQQQLGSHMGQSHM